MMLSKRFPWIWAIVWMAGVAAAAAADVSREATINLGRDPEPPRCVENPGGTVEITWSIQHVSEALRVDYELQDPTRTVILDQESYPGTAGLSITRHWTAPPGLPDGKYWVRVEYWSRVSGNEANAEVTFYLCNGRGTICAEKYEDADCNEQWTSTDPPLGGWWICLQTPYDESYCIRTADDGRICWNDIPPGSYRLSEMSAVGWRAVSPDAYDVMVEADQTQTRTFLNTQCPPPAACCFPDGSCSVLPVGTCEELEGVIYLGESCEPNPCPQPAWACCLPDGSCRVMPESLCLKAGGEVESIESCDPSPCPQPEGACCLPRDESCHMLPEAECLLAGGEWHAGDTCAFAGGEIACPSWRVCCIDVTCIVTTEEICTSSQGVWDPGADACSPENPCEDPVPLRVESWGGIKSLYR